MLQFSAGTALVVTRVGKCRIFNVRKTVAKLYVILLLKLA